MRGSRARSIGMLLCRTFYGAERVGLRRKDIEARRLVYQKVKDLGRAIGLI